MIQHTHDKTFLASQYGKIVVFMKRPSFTSQKAYREPVIMKTKQFNTISGAQSAKSRWLKKNEVKH